MRSGNPALNIGEGVFAAPTFGSDRMTVQGTANKTGLLLLLAFLGAGISWGSANASLWIMVGSIGGLVVAFVTFFKKEWAGVTAPIYALLEGLFLGALSSTFYPEIAIQAVGLTFGTLAGMLLAYSSGWIKVTERLRSGIVAATGGIMIFYLASFVLGFFGIGIPGVFDGGLIGIGFSLIVVGVAAFNLLLDFDQIDHLALQGAPKYFEWYGAFSLMVTLVWLYLEILRLLAKLQSDD